MATFAIARALIVLALIEGISSQCWEFDSSFSGWTNDGFQQAPGDVPETGAIPSYDPPTANYAWFQEQTNPPAEGTLTSPTITIDEDDLISATFFRHVEQYDGSDRINLTFFTGPNNRLILFTTNYDVWDTVSVHCGPTGLKCCPTYPCDGYFLIDGDIRADDELVAVSHIGINCLVPSTTDAAPETTQQLTTIASTTSTEEPMSSTEEPTSSPESTTELTSSQSSTSTSVQTEPSTLTSSGISTTEESTLASSTTEAITSTLAMSTAETITSTLASSTTETITSTSVTSSTLPPADCCTFDYNVCGWSLEHVSNGWHWSPNKQPDLLPPFTSPYIWLQDASAGVASGTIPNVGTGTTFAMTYFYLAGASSGELVSAYFGSVELAQLKSTGQVENFLYTCGSECCAGAETCSAQFHVDVRNQAGISLTISIDSFHVDDSTC